jgi:hypothetical protein
MVRAQLQALELWSVMAPSTVPLYLTVLSVNVTNRKETLLTYTPSKLVHVDLVLSVHPPEEVQVIPAALRRAIKNIYQYSPGQ